MISFAEGSRYDVWYTPRYPNLSNSFEGGGTVLSTVDLTFLEVLAYLKSNTGNIPRYMGQYVVTNTGASSSKDGINYVNLRKFLDEFKIEVPEELLPPVTLPSSDSLSITDMKIELGTESPRTMQYDTYKTYLPKSHLFKKKIDEA